MNDASTGDEGEPRDGERPPAQHGVSRRGLLKAAGGLALGGVTAASLAGCEDTTTPVAAYGAAGGGGRGILGDPTAGGPVDASGIPLARRDYPVTLPRLGDPVKAGKPETGGELLIYNYADYLNPAVLKEFGRLYNVSVRVTTFETLDEAFSKLSTGGLKFDVIFSTPDQLSRLVGRKLIQPLNYDLIPNLRKNVWPEAAEPFYDVGPRYSVPYTVYTTGIGWRNDIVDYDPAKMIPVWDAMWAAEQYRGKVQLLNDYREAIGMGLMHSGSDDLNTERPVLINASVASLENLNRKVGVKVQISAYEALPAGQIVLGQVWSGDMLNAVISYLPKGLSPDTISYAYQEVGGPVFNDVITVASAATKPVLAHHFLNFILDNKISLQNFIGYTGYQPPLNGIDAALLLKQGLIPKGLQTALVTRDAYANGNAYLTLTTAGQRLWEDGWTRFQAG
ncbi:MAG TPA: spermidine/putrescine ABC transporter substrate-binding protein [Solirubrobacteraceae bacterium]|nr:spermidine/putrescine ABC transporter substrate-binding protein [Solirubrobacteraceae bacterium]